MNNLFCPITYIKQKPQLFFILLTIIIGTLSLYGYSQYYKKSFLSAILINKVDLSNPPDSVLAISSQDQKLFEGKTLPRGTKFIGRLVKEGNNYVIYFEDIQTSAGNKLGLSGKTNLNITPSQYTGGVSAKISKTIHQQTQSNVIGAIFKNSGTPNSPGSVLERGTLLKIEVY